MPAFGLIIVHFKAPAEVMRLIDDAYSRWTSRPERIVVVDNSESLPADFAAGYLPKVVEVIRRPNLGYGDAVNVGVEYLKAGGHSFALICTQDVEMEPDTAEILLEEIIRSGNIAITAPLLRFSSDHRRIFSAGGDLSSRGIATHRLQGAQDVFKLEPYDVPWADGAALLIRISHFQAVGGVDPAYFLYVEEIDLQYALTLRGLRVMLCPAAVAYQEPGNYTDFLRYRNSLYFTLKNKDTLRAWPWKLRLIRDIVRRLVKGVPFDFQSAVAGARAAIATRMGRPQ